MKKKMSLYNQKHRWWLEPKNPEKQRSRLWRPTQWASEFRPWSELAKRRKTGSDFGEGWFRRGEEHARAPWKRAQGKREARRGSRRSSWAWDRDQWKEALPLKKETEEREREREKSYSKLGVMKRENQRVCVMYACVGEKARIKILREKKTKKINKESINKGKNKSENEMGTEEKVGLK